MGVLLIKGGRVLDPANRIDQVEDVAVENGKILSVREFSGDVQFTVDATGCIVTPGLIDHHVHLYPLMANGIPAEAVSFAAGVTTAVDAGSTGCATYPLHRGFLETSKLNIFCWLNVCTSGLASLPILEDVNPANYNQDRIAACFEKYGDRLMGLKLRTSKNIVGELGYEPLRQTVRLADSLGVPVMVHCTNPPGPMEELLEILRPGDVLTHMYQNIGPTILDESGHVSAAAKSAREKGVVFEAADARAHFSFEVSEPAIAEGFLPDIFATDLTVLSMYQRPTSFSLAMQLNKYMHLGLSLEEVITRCTLNPAKRMNRLGEIGTLTPGAAADVAVFRPEDSDNTFGDRPFYEKDCVLRSGKLFLRPVLTLKNGEIVYRDISF